MGICKINAMKRSCLLGFLVMIVFAAPAQPKQLVTTAEQHARWMELLCRQPVTGRRTMIADRMLTDTQIVVHRPYCHVGLLSEKQKKEVREQGQEALRNKYTGIRMPLVVIDGYPIQQDYYQSLSATEASAFAALIRITPFRQICPVNGPAATALYGIRGSNGVLLLDLAHKKQLQQFRAIRRERVATL